MPTAPATGSAPSCRSTKGRSGLQRSGRPRPAATNRSRRGVARSSVVVAAVTALFSTRETFAEIWDDIGGEHGDPLHVCVLAHSMADVQDDVHAELLWALRALDAADGITDERAAGAGVRSSVAAFYPHFISI